MREPALEIRPDLGPVAHEIARPQEEVDEIERGRSRLELFVAVDCLEQALLDERRQVRVRLAGEGLQRRQELRVRGEDLVPRHAAPVAARVPLMRTLEGPLAEQADQRRLEPVVVPGRHSLARADVLAQPPQRPEVRVERVRGGRARGELCLKAVHPRDERLDRRRPVERAPLPRRPEVAPAGDLPTRPPEPVDRVAVERAPAQRAPEPFRRGLELLGEPGVEGAAVERLGLRLRQHLEARVHARLDGPLVEKVVAEAVDRADARLLEVGDGVLEPRAPRATLGRPLALLLESGAQSELQLAGRLLGERERRDRLDSPAPLGQDVDEARHQLARLPGAGRRLDDERLVERRPDALPLGLVDEHRHGQSLSARSSSICAWSFNLIRVSSCGPQTSRKSQI